MNSPKRKTFFILLTIVFALQVSWAQVKVTTSWTLDALPKEVNVGDEVELIFNLSIIKDWYIYTEKQKEDVMAIPTHPYFELND